MSLAAGRPRPLLNAYSLGSTLSDNESQRTRSPPCSRCGGPASRAATGAGRRRRGTRGHSATALACWARGPPARRRVGPPPPSGTPPSCVVLTAEENALLVPAGGPV